MTRTISADDLEPLARAAHADIELPGPEGGWATAVINGREYRARVGAVPVAGDYADLAPETVPPVTSPGPVTGRILLCGDTHPHDTHCPVCGGKESHHRACPRTVIGVVWCKCSPAEVEDGFCVLCGNPFRVGGAV